MELRTPLALLLLAALACEPRQHPTPTLTFETRDSAGIQIVENARPPEGLRLEWRIGSEPTVSIGVLEGEEPYMLYRAFDATRLSDGRIVVANGGTDELRVFEASGIHVATWGGWGEGPGEFTGLNSVEPWPGDSVVAWYAPQLGFSVFDADGRHGRTFAFTGQDNTLPMLRFWPRSATRDGSILAWHAPEGSDTAAAQLRNGEGVVRSSFGTHPGREPYISDQGTDRAMLFWKTFGREPIWTPWGDQIAIAHTAEYEIKAYRADGSLARLVRRDHSPRTPTPEDVEAYIEEQLGSDSRRTESEIQEWRRRYQAVPVAEHFPAFESIRSDALDHLWVEEYQLPREEGSATVWTVFDPDGQALGLVETPTDLRISEIGADYILGYTFDEFDVQYVQLWSLER